MTSWNKIPSPADQNPNARCFAFTANLLEQYDLPDGAPPEPEPVSGLFSTRGHPLGVHSTTISWYYNISNAKES